LWRIVPSTLRPYDPAKPAGRKKLAGPLIDLPQLQEVLNSRQFDLDDLWIATDRCELDLENYQWTYDKVQQMLVSLVASDYRNSEWCGIRGGHYVPCDVYLLPYDLDRHQRNSRAEAVYLKFSIDEAGALSIVLVSCHPPR
jgi:hypothetical protein